MMKKFREKMNEFSHKHALLTMPCTWASHLVSLLHFIKAGRQVTVDDAYRSVVQVEPHCHAAFVALAKLSNNKTYQLKCLGDVHM